MPEIGSKDVAAAAMRLALTADREEENKVKAEYKEKGILVAASEYGGDFISAATKIIERAVVSAKREGLIRAEHQEEGAVAGAAREALSQLVNKAIGLNVGGKIGVARGGGHVSVCIFFGIGLLHLNEVAVGLGHRAI